MNGKHTASPNLLDPHSPNLFDLFELHPQTYSTNQRPMSKHLRLNQCVRPLTEPMCKYLLLNWRSSSHNLTISASSHTSRLVLGVVRLVQLGWVFYNLLWVYPQLNILHCDSPSPLSDLPGAHHSPATFVTCATFMRP